MDLSERVRKGSFSDASCPVDDCTEVGQGLMQH